MEFRPLAGRARLLFHVSALLRLVLLWLPLSLLMFGVLLCAVPWRVALVVQLGFLLVVGLAAVWLPTLSFDRWGWALTDDALLITHGVLLRRVTAIPTHRIQHVDTRQGPFEQLLGLTRLRVYTASGSGADGVIPGLDAAEAEALRDQLMTFEGDDGV